VTVELFGLRLTIGGAVAEFYCFDYSTADNDPNAWWIPGGYWETMVDQSASCARQYVIVDSVTFSALVQVSTTPPTNTASNGPFDLSISDGGLISGAVAGVWALAWVLRQLRAALDTDGEKE